MKEERHLHFQSSQVHHHLHLQCERNFYAQVLRPHHLIEQELISKEFLFEPFWWQHQVNQLNLELS